MKTTIFRTLTATTVLFVGLAGTVHPQDAPTQAQQYACAMNAACMQGVRDRLMLEQARSFAAENERDAATQMLRGRLTLAYEAIGLDHDQAALVAAGYTFDRRTAPYIGLGLRIGAKGLVDQAIDALGRNDFDTANRMLAAAYLVLHAHQASR